MIEFSNRAHILNFGTENVKLPKSREKDRYCVTLVLGVTGREVPEPADRRLQTRRMPLWNAMDSFIREKLVLPVMYDSVHSVLVKQHGYIQWTNCTKNTLLGN